MKKQTITTHSVAETIAVAENFAMTLNKGVVITLTGDLGVGKTAFTKGIARGLGIEEAITSPTFTLLKEYTGRLDLKHIDAYRLENLSSDTLALFDLIDDHNVVVLEWAQYIQDSGIKVDYNITLEYLEETTRLILIEEVNS